MTGPPEKYVPKNVVYPPLWEPKIVTHKEHFLRKTCFPQQKGGGGGLWHYVFTEAYCPASIYLPKNNNRDIGIKCDMCSKLTIKVLRFHSFFTPFSSVFAIGFDQVNVCWAVYLRYLNVGLLKFRLETPHF